MWPWILGSAALGGLQAYGQSGGDIGKTLTGAAIGGGLGALGPAATRMAGAFAGGPATAAIAPSIYRAGQRLSNPLATAGTLLSGQKLAPITTPLVAQQLGGQALLSKAGAGLAGLGIASAIPTVAAGAANMLPQAAGGGTRMAGGITSGGLATAGAAKEALTPGPTGDWNAPPTPDLSRYGAENYLSVASPLSRARGEILRGQLEAEAQLRNLKTLLPYESTMIQKARDADLLRQMAAYQKRTQIDAGAQAMAQAQLAAQALAQQGSGAVLNAMAQRGGYV